MELQSARESSAHTPSQGPETGGARSSDPRIGQVELYTLHRMPARVRTLP